MGTPGDGQAMMSGGPYSLTSPPERLLMSDTVDPDTNASPFETKFTVLKFNSGTKIKNNSNVKYKKQLSNAANSSSNSSLHKIDLLFKK